jgi:hypothetical protein
MVNIWRKIFSLRPHNSNGVLLIEQVGSNISLHLLCVYGYVITRAKNLTPVFIVNKKNKLWLEKNLVRYFDQFQILDEPRLSILNKLFLFIISSYKWVLLLTQKQLITLEWRERLIGDIVYDQYLSSCRRGTLYYFDLRLLKNIYHVIYAVEIARKAVMLVNPYAVLRSHQVGLSSAPIAVACEEYGIPIYSIGGTMYGTLICSKQRKDYFYTATSGELKPLLELSDVEFDNCFEGIKKESFQGNFNADSKLSFSKKLFTKRVDFTNAYDLDAKKKNIFIMLHAFTDYPHSHFNGMLFNDYLDWFLKTLAFISDQKSVNWIIKQHPSSQFYPVEDMEWDELIEKYSSSSLVFMSHDADFDSRSVCHVCDAVVTCIGSAGFEFPALCGIPSVTAGDNHYIHAGFSVNPRTRQEYFETLNNIGSIERLSEMQLRNAKAAFMFIHRFSRVEMKGIINLSHQEHRDYQFSDRYFEMAEENAEKYESQISADLEKYINTVSQADFYALRSSPLDY